MFIIDFGISRADILSMISNRDYPAWTIPVFDFIKSWLDESINSFEVQTSGSTGSPKLIIHSREAMIESAERTCVFFKLQKNNIALLALPATHIGGKMMIVRSIIRGLKLICIEPKSDPSNELSFDGKIDFAAFTPMQMSKMLNNSSSNEKLIRLKQIILGGGEISYPLRHRLQDIYPSVY
jgi:O-succinylbenzoic acid--CoA ligase